MSTSTAERLLRSERQPAPRALSTTQAGPLLKQHIPIRTFEQWNETHSGFLEGDVVVSCGADGEGCHLSTFILTDSATGWTECFRFVL